MDLHELYSFRPWWTTSSLQRWWTTSPSWPRWRSPPGPRRRWRRSPPPTLQDYWGPGKHYFIPVLWGHSDFGLKLILYNKIQIDESVFYGLTLFVESQVGNTSFDLILLDSLE